MATLTSEVMRTAQRRSAVAAPAITSTRANMRSYVRLLVGLDTAVVAIAVLGGYLARFQGEAVYGARVPYPIVAAGLFLVWLGALRVGRCYDDRVLGHGSDEYRRVVSASLKLAGAIAISFYILDLGISRGFLGISFFVGTLGLAVMRHAARKRLHRARAKGTGWSRRVLVVGDASHVMDLIEQLRREPNAGYMVVGACIPDSLLAPVAQHLDGVPVVGSFRTILESAANIGADTVAVAGAGELSARRLRRLGWQLEGTRIDLVLAPALTDVAGPAST